MQAIVLVLDRELNELTNAMSNLFQKWKIDFIQDKTTLN